MGYMGFDCGLVMIAIQFLVSFCGTATIYSPIN